MATFFRGKFLAMKEAFPLPGGEGHNRVLWGETRFWLSNLRLMAPLPPKKKGFRRQILDYYKAFTRFDMLFLS